MKFKRIMLVTIVLLAILTIGAVSASEDNTNETLAVEDIGDVSLDASFDDEIIAESGDAEEIGAALENDVLSNDSWYDEGIDWESTFGNGTYTDWESYFGNGTGNGTNTGGNDTTGNNTEGNDTIGNNTEGNTTDGNNDGSGDGEINGDDIELWINTDDDFSIAPKDLGCIFATVRAPEGTEGNVIFISDDRNLYDLALSDFDEDRIDRNNSIYNIALEVDGKFIFEGLGDGEWFKFAFIDENGNEIAGRDFHIFFGDNTVRFELDAHNPGDQVSIDVNWEANINDSDDFVWINLPSGVTEGKVMVTSGEFTLFEEEINFDEGTHWWKEIDEHYVCSFSPDSLTDWDKLNTGDIVTFAFLDGEDQMVESKDYKVTFEDDDVVRFEECQYVNVEIWDENDERGTLYTDSEGNVVSVYVPRSYEGNVFHIFANGNEISWEAEFDGDNDYEYKDWGLEDLGITEAGDYNIVVELDNGEDNEILLNTTITVSEFKQDDFRAMILYAQEAINFYCPEDGEGTIIIVTQKEIGGDRTEEVFEESYEITDEYRGKWTEFALKDLGFEADGAFRIFTLTVTNATGDEVYRYRISYVDGEREGPDDLYREKIEFAFVGQDDEDIVFNKTSDVLVAWLYIPNGEEYEDYADVSATVYVSLNGEIIKTIRTSDFDELERPNHYPIILDLSDLKDRGLLSFRVEAVHEDTGESAIDEEEFDTEWLVAVEDQGDYVIFHDDVDFKRLEFSVFAGNLTLGTTNDPDLMGVIKHNLVIITISDGLDITEGTITVSDEKSTVFTKQLSDCDKEYDYGSAGYTYYLSLDDVKDILPEDTNLAVSFNYADNTLSQIRIRHKDYLYALVTVEDINNQYRFEIQDDLMLHKNDTAIRLYSDTNRQAIYFDLGGGYFTVYVNGVKVENLGRVSYNTWKNEGSWRYDDEDYLENYAPDEDAFLNHVASYWGSELELFRLTSWTQGAPEMEITLADLGINESGTYNIRIAHYPSVPGGLDDHSALGYESMYAGEMLIPTVTEVLDVNITCNFDPDYAGVNIYPVTIYRNGIPFLFTFEFGDNILSQSNNVLIYVDDELAFNSTVLYYAENDEGEMELEDLWIVGPEMLNEALFDEYGLLDVGEYEAVVYLVKGDDAPVEIGRGNFSRIKQRGDMNFTIGSSDEDDGIHTIIYADIPEGDWTDYTLEINIADSEGVYPEGDDIWVYWFNEYVIFKDDDIYLKEDLADIIGKGPVAIDLGVLDEGTRIFVALEHGEETVFGDWDFYHNYFTAGGQGSEIPDIEDLYNLCFYDEVNIGRDGSTVLEYEFDSRVTGTVAILINGTEVYNRTIDDDYVEVDVGDLGIEDYAYGNYVIEFVYSGDETFSGFTKSHDVELTYGFVAYIEDDWDVIEYGHPLTFYVSMPYDPSADLVYIINGKEYTVSVRELYDVDRYLTIDAKDIALGKNNVTFSYVSDNYPLETVEYPFTSYAVVHMPTRIAFDEPLYVTVTLPEDANGVLNVYEVTRDYDEYEYEYDLLTSGNVKNGIGNVSVSGLSIGTHRIYVNYTGDYDIYLPVSEWDDIPGVYVSVTPKIIVPERVWVNGTYTGEFILPENYNGTLDITIGDETKSFTVVNGTATFDLFNLNHYGYCIGYSFDDGEHYYDGEVYIDVETVDPRNALKLFESGETQVVVKGAQSYGVELTLPYFAAGNVTVYVDDDYYCTQSADEEIYIRISTDNLTVGKHDVRFEYSGDNYFAPDTAYDSFNVSTIAFEIPQCVMVGENRGSASTALVLLSDDATGEVKLIVDGIEIATQQVEDGRAMFGLSNLTYGNHTVTLAYQNGNYPAINKTVNVEARYNLVIGDLIYGKEDAYVQLPVGATGKVTADVAGKRFTATVDKDGIARFNISGLIGGDYVTTVTYEGDDTYLPGSETFNLTVFYKVCSNFDEEDIFVDNLANYSYELILPENATGRLVVGFYEWDDYVGDDVFKEIAGKDLVNGKALITLEEVFADYDDNYVDLYAKYDGEDYDVDYAWNYVSINRYDVIGPENYADIALGETAVYTIKLSGNITGYFKVSTGRKYATVLFDNIPIVDGEATISIVASTLGEQSFKFYCADADLIIYREISVSPLNATLADEASGDDAVLTVQMPDDASGNLTLYIYAWDDDDEKLLAFTSAYEGGIAVINASNIPVGRWIESYYLIDDAKYGKSSFREGYDFIIKEVEEEIIPVDANLTVSASDITAGEVAVIDITIASNATGMVTVDGKEVTMVNGTGKYEISGLAGGVYNYTVKFAGDKYFNAGEKTVTIKVAKLASTVAIDVGSSYNVGDSFTIAITNSTAAVVLINNKTYEVKDGKVVINTTALSAGTYEVVATIAEDDMFSASSDNATFTINLIGTEIIVVNESLDLYTLDYVEDAASLNPADAGNLTFVSSDDNIVSIVYGMILANSPGTATVTVSFAGDDKYAAAESKTITVTVRLKDASVSVENDTLELKVDDRYELNATTVPGFLSVGFASSNESVATVTEYGLVTAVGEGTAVITLTVGNGETYAVNSTNVTVKVSKAPSEIITVNDTLVLVVGDEVGAAASLIPSDAGDLTYVISNEDVINVVNGTIVAVGSGHATVTYSFAGNDAYAAAESKTIAVTVSAIETAINVSKTSYELNIGDEDVIAVVTTPEGLKVDFDSFNSSVVSVDGDGKIVAVGEGETVIYIGFGDNVVYKYAFTTVNVTVSKVPTEIMIASSTGEMSVGGMGHAAAELNPSEAGELNYASNDTSVVSVSSTGVLKANGAGTALITVSFAGNDKYAAAENKAITITVNLKDVSVSVDDSTLELFIGDNATIVATTAPAGLNVTYVPDNSGVVSVDDKGVVTALKEGTGSILVKVGGDGVYAENSTTVTVTVSKAKAPIDNDSFNFDENKTVESKTPTYSISLPSNATGTLTVTVGNRTYTKELVNGTATVEVTDLPAGDYDVTVTYSGDSKYSAIVKKSKASVKVDPRIEANDLTVQHTAGKYYSVTVYGDDGKVASGVQVTFYLNGKKVATATTDKNGVAKFKVTQTPVKDAQIKSVALGKSVTKKLTIKRVVSIKSITVKKTSKKIVLKATLAKVNGKYLVGKKITFKFNGKTFKAVKTKSKGVATLTITPKKYKAVFTKLSKTKKGKKITYSAKYSGDTVTKTTKLK